MTPCLTPADIDDYSLFATGDDAGNVQFWELGADQMLKKVGGDRLGVGVRDMQFTEENHLVVLRETGAYVRAFMGDPETPVPCEERVKRVAGCAEEPLLYPDAPLICLCPTSGQVIMAGTTKGSLVECMPQEPGNIAVEPVLNGYTMGTSGGLKLHEGE
ncbi:hypothetical protein KIPB_004725 [Kipferlia bialata]|uniref:Uncharacterized protein n=1 Tax=Kipferlia bialata TaxID=797122 RepID=A0A9K3CU92_9EUKA|nr:hypothetical protein KIPB_004725 [Kipferlia bialata]|eukprot:g4725.t1